MKKSKQKGKAEIKTEFVKEKECDVSKKTREKYHKEIATTKETRTKAVRVKKESYLENEDVMKNLGDEEKFSELKKYLLTDLSGKKVSNSSPVKKKDLKKTECPEKDTMLDTIEEINPTSMQNSKNSEEKTVKKSPSPKKLTEKTLKLDVNSTKDTKKKTPRKQTKAVSSPEKSVLTASPRTGSRQRSPNLRYADDMVVFALKSPAKRQIFKKENDSPDNTNSNKDSPPVTSTSTESQTSQLYSLLTGTVQQKQESPTNVKSNEQTDDLNKNIKTESMNLSEANENIKQEAESGVSEDKTTLSQSSLNSEEDVNKLEKPVLNHDQCIEKMEESETVKTETMSEEKFSNLPEFSKLSTKNDSTNTSSQVINNKSSLKNNSSPTKNTTDPEVLRNLSNVIDQILIESVQEEKPDWEIYKEKPPKIKRPRKPIATMSILNIKSTITEKEDVSSGDDDDGKGKRRTTKPISKRSIIRMSPALGLLVGHDEDGFMMADKKKYTSDTEENDKDSLKKKPKSALKPDKKLLNKTNVKSDNANMSSALPKSVLPESIKVSTTVTKPFGLQPQMTVLSSTGIIGHIGTKATIVSGSQTVPCVLVSNTLSQKPQSILNLPQPTLATPGSFIIPANRISLIGTTVTNALSVSEVSTPTTILSPIIPTNIPLSSSIRPSVTQVISSLQQPVSVLRAPTSAPNLSNCYKLSSDGQLISSLGTTGVKLCNSGQNTTTISAKIKDSQKNSPSNVAGLNLPLKSKVLILKKSDIPTTAAQILVSSPSGSGMKPGMSLLKKLPITTTTPQQGLLVSAPPSLPKSVNLENSKCEVAKKKPSPEPLNNLISKVKTNMNSLMQLPDCLVSSTFIDSVMINEEYENESSEDESCDLNTADDQKDLDKSCNEKTTEDNAKLTNNDTDTNENSKQVIETNEAVTVKKNDKPETKNVSVDKLQLETEAHEEKTDKHTECDKKDKEDQIKAVKDNSGDVKTDEGLKDQSNITLENKLKKAMQSLSNVKSVLASKMDATKLAKHDSKVEVNILKDKDNTHEEKGKVVGNEIDPSQKEASDTRNLDKLSVPKDNDLLGGSNSESEDQGGESGKRRNIFDMIMTDYQSPNKEGKSDTDMDKSVNIEQESLSKPTVETDLKETEKPAIVIEDTDKKIESMSDKTEGERKESENDDDIIEMDIDKSPTDDQPQENLDANLKPEMPDDCFVISDVEQNDELESNSKELTMADKLLAKFKKWDQIENKPDGLSKPCPKENISKSAAVSKVTEKLGNGLKTPTMSPVKIEKFGNKSPFSKPPIKLKICSSPSKSYVVAPSNVSASPTNTVRPVPKTSTQREIKEPLPMDILSKPEQEVTDKLSAFSSEALDNFLENQAEDEIEDDQNSDDGSDDDDGDDNDDSDDDDDNEDDDENGNEVDEDDDSDMSMDENEPDFDEIDGILFMSFPSKNALKAHVHVERRTKLGSDENLLLGMTRMRNMRRKQGYILSKFNKKVGNKFFKDQDNISQNLRGMHKTLAKYQRLYKQELYWLQNPDDGLAMSKTSDITKIKGWKKKVGNVTDDVELAKAEIENGGKLHWRTEARLAKNLRPDELKEYGLNIKKKRRKNIIYTQRKGMSKGDRSQRPENDQEEFENSRSNSNDIEYIDDDVEQKSSQMDVTEELEGAFVFDPDDDVQDEELVRINERELLEESETRKNTVRHRMFLKAQMLKKRLDYNLSDIQVIRKLGGHNIRRRKNADGVYEGDYMVIMDNPSRPSTPDTTQTEESEKETPHKRTRKPKTDVNLTILSASMASAACVAIPKEFVRKKPKSKPRETNTPSKSPEPGQSTTCDKPGCRYGCICHLCVFAEPSSEADPNLVKCEKEYCRLGCICDSIGAHKEMEKKNHCGKSECMVECVCENGKTSGKRERKDDEDYHYTGQKKNSKFAALPRRESTYRLAKNLDAVSRKAMLYYESSEMFVDQKVRRRRSKESATEPAPEIYIDIDKDDFEMDQQVSTGSSKGRKQEFGVQKTQQHKMARPKSAHSATTKKSEMTDFSNIKSEISSQGSWNLSDLSDEYEDVETLSDKDSEFTSCARTSFYSAIKREKRGSGCTCNCGKDSSKVDGLGCKMDDGKFNIPADILSSGKWHTQWICLRSKGQTLKEADKKGIRLLEVISNCDYEDMKAKILSRLTSHISEDSYPILKSFIVGPFLVSLLPQSEKPAVIPPEVQAKLPSSVYSIRIQIIKDPGAKTGPQQVINLVNDGGDTEKTNGQNSYTKTKTILGKSELAKHLIAKETKVTTSSAIPGGISGLSRLQITRDSAPLVSSPNHPSSPISQGKMRTTSSPAIIDASACKITGAATVSQTVNMSASLNVTSTTAMTTSSKVQKFPGYQPKSVSTTSSVNVTTQSTPASNYSVLGTYSNLQAARTQLSNLVANQMLKPNPTVFANTGPGGPIAIKRKEPESVYLIHEKKKIKMDSESNQEQAPEVPNIIPTAPIIKFPNVNSNIDNSVGQISILRCVRCHVILTAEDITGWVLSQDSVQEKICVKCRNKSMQNTTTSVQKCITTPRIIESEKQVKGMNSVEGKNLVTTVEKGAKNIQNILHDIDNTSTGPALTGTTNSSKIASKNQVLSSSKQFIDLSADDGVKASIFDSDNGGNSKSNESPPINLSEEEDELEAAMRDAQDDYDDMARNLSDENESQGEDDKTGHSEKSNVIVIDDDDDCDVNNANSNSLKRKDNNEDQRLAAKRLKVAQTRNEEGDVDVTGYSENDAIDMTSMTPETVWHSSTCSLNSNLLRKKRKPQHITSANFQEVEISEGKYRDAEEYRLSRTNKERVRRSELHSLYNKIRDMVMTEQERCMLQGHPYIRILDKALEFIQVESARTVELEGKLKAFKEYQDRLLQTLNELKDFHIGRGISKEKLNFQLDKIAVVCDRIYEHLPEIKKHIRNKKEGRSQISPSHVTSQKMTKSKDVKRSSAQKKKPAEIYIDNPEEYNEESPLTQTSIASLPGSYVQHVPGRIISSSPHPPAISRSPASHQPIKLILPAPSTKVSTDPNIKSPKFRIHGTNIGPQGVLAKVSGQSSVQMKSANMVNMPTVNSSDVQNNLPSKSITLTLQCVPQPSGRGLLPNHRAGIVIQPLVQNSHTIPDEKNFESQVFTNTQTSELNVTSSNPEMINILNAPPGQNIGKHPSTAAFSEVIGQMIKKNISDHLTSTETDTKVGKISDSQPAGTKLIPPIPEYDMKLLKDQILDDMTGELISVIINDEIENPENSRQSSNDNKHRETSLGKSDIDSDSISVKGKCKDSLEGASLSNQLPKEAERKINAKDNDETNIESLLDDIKSLNGETCQSESPKKNSETISPTSKVGMTEPSTSNVFNPTDRLINNDKADQVDGDLFNFSVSKDLSESDSNNSARTNPYMEDSDGNTSLTGDISDEMGDMESSTPKIVSVMSIADVLGDNFENVDALQTIGPQGDNDSLKLTDKDSV